MKSLTEEFPLVLSTMREVGHYSCRAMTGNCLAPAALADEPGFVQMNDEDAAAGIMSGVDFIFLRRCNQPCACEFPYQ